MKITRIILKTKTENGYTMKSIKCSGILKTDNDISFNFSRQDSDSLRNPLPKSFIGSEIICGNTVRTIRAILITGSDSNFTKFTVKLEEV